MGDKAMRFAASNEGPWVFEVPSSLVSRLATLEGGELDSVALKWARTEEFSPKYENWPAEAVKQMLEGLVAMSKRAVSEGKALLMWVCL